MSDGPVFGPGTLSLGGKVIGRVEDFRVEEFDFSDLTIGEPGPPVRWYAQLSREAAWWVAARLRALADRLDGNIED